MAPIGQRNHWTLGYRAGKKSGDDDFQKSRSQKSSGSVCAYFGFGYSAFGRGSHHPFHRAGAGNGAFWAFVLAWVILGYFAIFDLGRATTKFVAEALGKGRDEEILSIV